MSPARSAHRLNRRWSGLAGVVVLTLVVLFAVVVVPLSPPGRGTAQAAAATTPYTVTATPTVFLTDGQRITITIKTDASFPIYQAEARVCRAGVTYQPSSASRPNDDFELGGPNCSPTPITSSADVTSVDGNVFNEAQTELGDQMSIRVGAGTVSWPLEAPTNTLTCDSANPCALVVELLGGPDGTWVPWTTPLTFRVDDPVAGCGGPATGVINSGGSDRISDPWVAWTLDECKQPGRHGAAARASFPGEGNALASYSTGGLDLAYTAAGYDGDVGLLPATDPPPARASVPVPLALNATVLAVGGGVRTADNQKLPYQPIKMTQAEAAALIGGGEQGIVPYLPAIVARNPELGTFFDTSSSVLVGASSDSEATSEFATNFFSSLQPDAFRVPDKAVFGTDAGRMRGADANLALADPSYANALSLLTGRPAFSRIVNGLSNNSSGGVWFLTDLASAKSLGLTVVELQNANGDFVGPTPESMAAAIPTMHTDADGMLIPDPHAAAGTHASASGAAAYPLTFVEYGLAPAAPLADATTNACRIDSQAVLAGWLTYITTTGQTNLPAGYQPLTSDLKAQAATQIPKVGATPAATPCTSDPTTPTTVAPIADGGGGSGGSFPTGGIGSFGSNPTGSSGSYSSTSPAATPAAIDATEPAAASGDVPDWGGSSTANGVVAAAALFGIIILTGLAAKATAGRQPRTPTP